MNRLRVRVLQLLQPFISDTCSLPLTHLRNLFGELRRETRRADSTQEG